MIISIGNKSFRVWSLVRNKKTEKKPNKKHDLTKSQNNTK